MDDGRVSLQHFLVQLRIQQTEKKNLPGNLEESVPFKTHEYNPGPPRGGGGGEDHKKVAVNLTLRFLLLKLKFFAKK